MVNAHVEKWRHRDARIPIEARPLSDDALVRRKRLPLLLYVAHVERSGVLDPDTAHDRLSIPQYSSKIPLHWLRQIFNFTRIEHVRTNSYTSRFKPLTQHCCPGS